ncbi:hypothetical protein ACFLTE_03560, partial [Bacteroidota bacterium]
LDEWFINGLILNSEFDLIEQYTTSRPEYQKLLGYSIKENNHYLFFSNEKRNEFYCKSINIVNKSSVDKPIEIDLENEQFVESIDYNNQFYLITINKLSSIINIYVFDGDKISNVEQVDLSDYKFSNNRASTLHEVLSKNASPFQNPINIFKIDCNNPYSLDVAAKENKIYSNRGNIFITLDNNIETTKLITIDLSNFMSNVKIFNQSRSICNDAIIVKTNSYISNNNIYQLSGCKQGISISISNHKTDSLIKEFNLSKKERKIFKNAPAIQDGGTTYITQGSKRTMQNTKKILRKITASDIGLAVNQLENRQELIIGGYKEIPGGLGGGGMVMTSPGSTFSTPTGNVTTPPTYEYDPNLYGHSKNPRIRTIYFKAQYNNYGDQQIEINTSINVYDKIKAYSKKMERDITSESIFKIGDYYVFGYYHISDKKYYLRKFVNW